MRADNRKMQQSLLDVSGKVISFAIEIGELQKWVANTEHIEMTTVRSIGKHVRQLAYIQTKIEDMENRQRKNNLRVFGVPEGKDGDATQQFIGLLFGMAFLDLMDWDSQIQRSHHLPISRNLRSADSKSTYPLPNLYLLGNFLLRQVISLKARLATLVVEDPMPFVVRSDFCKSTMGYDTGNYDTL
ncbi:hypothetical protein NDU88_001407 [Pleurodeles waltl]|uniref:Uncharacterized protein n=1 Tax=Pleurodeles waltl TaxID=8319 RepID=A0AAV7LD21_PLEWA|nr:hypothetical protein NDU88_001407 [Pleurodeles waltl]